MNRLPDFLIIPYQVISDPDIKPLAEKLYGVLYWFTKLKQEKCFASNETLAELLSTEERSIQRSLDSLEQKEYITRFFKDEAKRNREEIVVNITFERHKGHTSNDPQVTRERPTGHQKKNINNNILNTSSEDDNLKVKEFYLNHSSIEVVEDIEERSSADSDGTTDFGLYHVSNNKRLTNRELKALLTSQNAQGKTKSPKLIQTTFSDPKRFLEAYKTTCKNVTGTSPIFGKKEAIAITQILKKYGVSQMSKVADWFLNSDTKNMYKVDILNMTSTKTLNRYQQDTGNELKNI